MKRFIIQDKITKKYLKRANKEYSYVASVEDALLITTRSAAHTIVRNRQGGERYHRWYPMVNKVNVIEVNILLYPNGVQPFIDGVLNDISK